MKELHIWIDYHPRLYQDLLLQVLYHINPSEAGINFTLYSGRLEDHLSGLPPIDVILQSIDRIIDRPENSNLLDSTIQPIWIAFSPSGNQGWRRLTPDSQWEQIRPFGLQRLLGELLDMVN